jgi:adenosine/AMP kinase
LELKVVKVKNPEELNIIIGQSHFIKTAEDIYEAMVHQLIRVEGTDEELKKLAAENALAISAGHSFFIVMRDVYPINVLGAIRNVPEVCNIFCATANPVEVIIAETESGRGIMGVIDGKKPKGIEGPDDVRDRKELLRKFGYKK